MTYFDKFTYNPLETFRRLLGGIIRDACNLIVVLVLSILSATCVLPTILPMFLLCHSPMAQRCTWLWLTVKWHVVTLFAKNKKKRKESSSKREHWSQLLPDPREGQASPNESHDSRCSLRRIVLPSKWSSEACHGIGNPKIVDQIYGTKLGH